MAEYTIKSNYTGTEPITLTEAKTYLKVDGDDDNTYITELCSMVRQMVEKETNTALVENTFIQYYNDFPKGDFELQIAGNMVSADLIITYNSTSGTKTLAITTDYLYTKGQGLTKIQSVDGWPADVKNETNSIKIQYKMKPEGGIESATFLPLPLKQAMYLLLGHYYDNRSAVTFGNAKELPMGYKRIINNYKNTIFSR